jgi:hypothetical protein
MRWLDEEYALVYFRANAKSLPVPTIVAGFLALLVALSMAFEGPTVDGICALVVCLGFVLAFHFAGVAVRATLRDLQTKHDKMTTIMEPHGGSAASAQDLLIHCPRCQAAIPAEHVNRDSQLAKCGQCDEVFTFDQDIACPFRAGNGDIANAFLTPVAGGSMTGRILTGPARSPTSR